MKTLDIETLTKKLNNHFFMHKLIFRKSKIFDVLPTIEITLMHNKYVRNDQFLFTDKFKPELLKVLEKCGITDVTFNNTDHKFWWTEKSE